MAVDNQKLSELAKERAISAKTESEAYRVRLSEMQFYNWFTVVLPALLSLFAGTNVFAEIAFFGIDWKLLSGGAALLSSLLLAIHKARKCDEYQANCQVLIQAFSSLALRYQTLSDLKPNDIYQEIKTLDEEKAEILRNTRANLPEKSRRKARKNLENASP